MPSIVQFKPHLRTHELLKTGLTACHIEPEGDRRKGIRHRQPASAITCWQCRKNAGRLRPREGTCKTARVPGRKAVHLVGDTQKTPCHLTFEDLPDAVHEAPKSAVTCGHCMRFTQE